MTTAIEDVHGITAARFHDEIVPAARPVVMRGVVADWPAIAAAAESTAALGAYLGRFDRGRPLGAMVGPPRIKGRFFYNDALSGFNFRRQAVKLSGAFDFLLQAESEAEPPSFAIQSAQVWNNLPGFDTENPMPLLGPEVEPRVWIGNRVIVAAHQDPSENIACVVAGQRRFTLFPPDQIGNLYLGPMDRTPAGTPISMVDFDDPDPVAHPRFAEAMKAALVADVMPGDAIYIPYMWWHQVRSLGPMNMLVNYWWAERGAANEHPMNAMLHALLAIRDLPEAHRAAWRTHFDHYVFGQDAGAHLPEERRGMLAPLDADAAESLRDAIERGVSRS